MSLPMPELEGVEHSYVELGGVRVHVAQAGAGEPLVLLHGWPQHWWQWRRVIPRLAEHYRVICPDTRGFGWSDAPADGYEKEQLAADVIALLDALGLGRVRLMGHDWGGFVGFLLCLEHPARIECYLALNTAHPFAPVEIRQLGTVWRFFYQQVIATPLIGALFVGRRQGLLRRFCKAGAGVDAPWSDDELEVFLAPLREPERTRASMLLYRTFLLKEFPAMVRGRYRGKRLQTPTLFLHGRDDPVLRPKLLDGYEQFAGQMTLELVEDTGHWIAEEQPELVTRRALEFFAGGGGLSAQREY